MSDVMQPDPPEGHGPWVVVIQAHDDSRWPSRVIGPFSDHEAANDEADEQEIANGRVARIYRCTPPSVEVEA